MLTSRPRLPILRAMLALVAVLVILGSIVQLLPSAAIVTAQIDNNQPTQPYASVVNCIRAGANQGDLSKDSPRFATTCFGSAWDLTNYSGAGNPSNGDASSADSAVVEFGDATPDGSADLYGVIGNGHATLSTLGEMGSVFGLAYTTGGNTSAPAAARSQRLFVAAFAKRLTRFGPGGPGAIYVINRSTASNSLYVTVPDVVPGPNGAPFDAGDGSAGAFPNGAAYSVSMGGIHATQHDAISRAYVSKTGLGDIELDPQERYLYAVNLDNRLIYRFDTWDANPQGTMITLAQPPMFTNAQTCNVSGASGPQDTRPFGLLVTASTIYLGYVCSAQTSQDRRDLSAGVLSYDRATGAWSTALGTALSIYDSQRTPYAGDPAKETDWQPWRILPEVIGGNESYIHL